MDTDDTISSIVRSDFSYIISLDTTVKAGKQIIDIKIMIAIETMVCYLNFTLSLTFGSKIPKVICGETHLHQYRSQVRIVFD